MAARRFQQLLLVVLELWTCQCMSGCDFPGDSEGYRNAFIINNGQDLDNFLDTFEGSGFAKLNVINGTHWIHLGGKVSEFTVVLGLPPSSSSDTTLEIAMQKINGSSYVNPKRVIIEYHSLGIRDQIVEMLEQFPTDVWLFDNREEDVGESQGKVGRVIRMPERSFGLDIVFERVQKESILLEFDFNRLKKILTDVFARKSVGSGEITYLRRKARDVERSHKNTFTELYLSNLVFLFSEDNSKVLQSYRNHEMGHDLIFMPEMRQENVVYSKRDFTAVKGALNGDCPILELRAGIFLKDESMRNLRPILDEFPGLQLYLKAEPYDVVDPQDLLSAMKIAGLDRVLSEIPAHILTADRPSAPAVFVPSPRPPPRSGSNSVAIDIGLFYVVIYNALN